MIELMPKRQRNAEDVDKIISWVESTATAFINKNILRATATKRISFKKGIFFN
jgi:hypothetical protein